MRQQRAKGRRPLRPRSLFRFIALQPFSVGCLIVGPSLHRFDNLIHRPLRPRSLFRFFPLFPFSVGCVTVGPSLDRFDNMIHRLCSLNRLTFFAIAATAGACPGAPAAGLKTPVFIRSSLRLGKVRNTKACLLTIHLSSLLCSCCIVQYLSSLRLQNAHGLCPTAATCLSVRLPCRAGPTHFRRRLPCIIITI